MQLVYSIFIRLYVFLIWIAHFFNQKAKLWLNGRKDVWQNISKASNTEEKMIIWMHVSSLGEFEQGRPLIEELKNRYQHIGIVLTFFSPSGYEIRKNYPIADFIFYLPLDTQSNAERFYNLIQPHLVIFVKYDFWYFYIREAVRRKIPIILVSAIFRSNDIFFKWYGSLHRKMLKSFNEIFVQDEHSKKLIETLHPNATIAGDTRCDRVIQISQSAQIPAIIRQRSYHRFVVVIGSAWKEDIEVIKPVFEKFSDVYWIIAPHNIENQHLKALTNLLPQKFVWYSSLEKSPELADYPILIIDNIGMLSSLYSIAQLAYIGGGFGKGIHNILEPAVYGIPVIFGPKYQKFNEAVSLIQKKGAFSIKNTSEALVVFSNLIQNTDKLKQAGIIARQYVIEHSGATNIILQRIEKYLSR